ncbi:hypothetical protein EV182_004846 [Spiromyces aspiralis]|uniref:Uncharacterized protein n=1 Tax=Spiromyces aspiralis TaxID=68401 RepID=A0ACC1HD47_9FUNG|nr:hypothetical protein EV182_004846 [Spiromyces aspiralis]
MSVLNLEDSPVKRTALDDWESLLYVVCWLGTYGINEHTRRKKDGGGDDSELKDLDIRRWRYGSFAKIASDKRSHLESGVAFRNNILAGFNSNVKHCKMLTRLASDLRRTLVERKESGCWGSLRRSKEDESSSDLGLNDNSDDDSGGNKDLTDPFERRIEHCERISAELLGVLERYAEKAKKLIEALQQQQEPQEQQQQQQQPWWQRKRQRRRRGRGAQ